MSASDFADLVEGRDLGFAPLKVRVQQHGRSRTRKFSASSLEWLRDMEGRVSIEVTGEDGSVRLAGIAGWPTQLVILRTPGWPPERLIDAGSRLPGFASALVGDGEDVLWQSTDQINIYESRGRQWRDLPRVPDELFGGEKIDISVNPGRQEPAPGMWLWAASKMWFSPLAFDLIDQDRLLSLPMGRVSRRPDAVVVVELYDLTDDLGTIRAAQRSFREWLGYDGLSERSRARAGELGDPCLEIDTGEFPHGGVRLFTEWLDDLGRPAPKSRATKRRCAELDTRGHAVWREIVDLE